MNTFILLLAALPAFAAENDFARPGQDLLASLQPQDVISATPECGIADSKTLRPFSRDEALKSLSPCFNALSAKYGSVVALEAAPRGLAVVLEKTVTMTSPLRRDLGFSLQRRDYRLLGQTVSLVREGEKSRVSRLQEQFDACPKPMVVRKIKSSEDFLKYYGGCVNQSGIEVRPSPGHQLGLMVRGASRPQIESYNGVLTVMSTDGLVEMIVMAYPEQLDLP